MSAGTWRKRRKPQGIRHSWPDTTPPCRTSEAQRCARCGLERCAIPTKRRSARDVMSWRWEYTRVVPNWLLDPKKLTIEKTTEPGPCKGTE